MDLARELAEHGRYTASPNPLVGAVISRGNEVLGEGWHARAGDAHAEIAALGSSGVDVRGATMHVTLEPCNHHGRTPPCTEAIIRADISKVVVGHLDPDPRMRGRSVATLREAGIEVEVLEDPALTLQNEQFFTAMRLGRPRVHLKLAATLDGKIAAANGDSKWVTGEAARLRARMLRAEAGAVLVGAGTVRADDPLLTARDLVNPPRIERAVLDPRLTTRPDSQLARTAHESPVVAFTRETADKGRAKALKEAGVEVVHVPGTGNELDLDFRFERVVEAGSARPARRGRWGDGRWVRQERSGGQAHRVLRPTVAGGRRHTHDRKTPPRPDGRSIRLRGLGHGAPRRRPRRYALPEKGC